MDRKKLATACESLKALQIPPAPDSGELAEWRADLIEMDAFYAGIASTVLNGGAVKHHLEDLDTLAATLRSIQPRTERDRQSYEAGWVYLNCLQEIREALGADS